MDDTWYNDGLHCGGCFDALIGEEWVPVRIEYTENGHKLTRGWYLFGPDGNALPDEQQRLDGMRVKLK